MPRFWAVLASSLVFLALALVPPFAAGSMKLLSRNTGWVSNSSNLYWTKDAGNQWTDITPVPPGVVRAGVSLQNVFFRDTSEGWVIVAFPDKPAVSTFEAMRDRDHKTLYAIAHTLNGGDSWSFAPLSYPELPQWIQDTFAGTSSLFFLDLQHGWLEIAFEGNSKPGKLLATQDGGETWKWVNSPGFSGPITFASVRDGFLLGYFGGEKFYATHDGCTTWQEVNLPAPQELGKAIYPTFQAPPIFQDQRRGYLVVHYSGGPGVPTKLVVYLTIDSGKTWRPVKVLAEAGGEHTQAAGFPFSIVDSFIIISTGVSGGKAAIASVPLDGGTTEVSASNVGVAALTFADLDNGWIHSVEGGLMSTQDRGASWKRLSPSRAAPSLPGKTVPVQNGHGATVVPNDELLSPSTELQAAGGGVEPPLT